MLSIVIPVYYRSISSYVYKRAQQLILYFSSQKDVEVIVVDTSNVSKLKTEAEHVKVIHEPFSNVLFSPAKARNIGIHYAGNRFVFFLDVDLDFGENFIQMILEEIKLLEKGYKNFMMLPCLYLSKEGTRLFEQTDNKANAISFLRESFLRGENRYVQHIAMGTSAIVVKKNLLEEIGFFDESFEGHGGEDFELLHRIASKCPHSIRNTDYYINEVKQFVGDYVGFRKYFAFYSMEYIWTDLLMVHKWHPRPLLNMFYMKKKQNHDFLVERMKYYDEKYKEDIWVSNKPIPDLNDTLKAICKKNGSECVGFFRYGEKNVRTYGGLDSKVRKLLLDPKKFFADMKLIKYIVNKV